MTPHEVRYPHGSDPHHGRALPLLLGIVAIALIGILVLTNSN